MKIDERIAARARKNQSAILIALSEVSQAKVAELLGESDSTVSRFKGAELERFAAMLAAAGLKVVDEKAHFMSDSRKKSLCEIAALGLEAIAKEDSEWGGL